MPERVIVGRATAKLVEANPFAENLFVTTRPKESLLREANEGYCELVPYVPESLHAQSLARIASLEAENATILSEARSWAMEAKTQRATVREVGQAVGSAGDWAGIADLVRERFAALEAALKEIAGGCSYHSTSDDCCSGPEYMAEIASKALSTPTQEEGT